eukprot:775456_1
MKRISRSRTFITFILITIAPLCYYFYHLDPQNLFRLIGTLQLSQNTPPLDQAQCTRYYHSQEGNSGKCYGDRVLELQNKTYETIHQNTDCLSIHKTISTHATKSGYILVLAVNYGLTNRPFPTLQYLFW